MIPFQGNLDKQIVLRAARAQFPGQREIAGFLLFAGLWGGVTALLDPSRFEGSGIAAIGFVFVLGLLLLVLPYIAASRALSTSAVLREPFHGFADEDHIVITSAVGSSDLPWEMLHRVLFGKGIILLFISANQFHLFSERFFSDPASWNGFQSLIREKVPKKRIKKVRQPYFLWLSLFVVVIVLYMNFHG